MSLLYHVFNSHLSVKLVSTENFFITSVKRKCSRWDGNDSAHVKRHKVTAEGFTPRSLRLNNKSKKALVLITVTEMPYPSSLNHLSHIGKMIRKVALDPTDDPGLKLIYKRLISISELFEVFTI